MNRYRYQIIGALLISIFFFSCTSKKETNSPKKQVSNSSRTVQDAVDSQQKKTGSQADSIIFDSVKVISMQNSFMASSKPDTAICKSWNLSQENIKKLMKLSREISIREWHYQFDVMSCVIEGEFRYNGKNYEYGINSGAWFDITYQDTTIRYGCFKAECEKYFLSKAWVPNNEN